MQRVTMTLVAGLLVMAQGVPEPVPRDLPGPPAAPGQTPPERIERSVPRDGVLPSPYTPPMPQADLPEERPGTPREIMPPNDGLRSPPGLQMR